MPHPLNQILYGPPGTGKTYATVERAVRIANPEFGERGREAIREEYRRLVAEGRIVFTTFHQSLSYEDFVEGLKPILGEEADDEGIRYEIKPGIFRQVVTDASYAYAHRQRMERVNNPSFIAVWNAFLADVRTQLEFRQPLPLKTRGGTGAEIVDITTRGNLHVKHVSGERAYTISYDRQARLNEAFDDLDAIGNIYTAFNEVIGGSNASLQWAVLRAVREFERSMSAFDKEESQKKLSREDRARVVRSLGKIDFGGPAPERYVLIVDEINRGNVSAILGELITLLEPDKRLGRAEALTVTLPYSREEFGVPPNLYLIGTMNTADRSVERLDAALRRRFVFREVAPDAGVIRAVHDNAGLIEIAGRTLDLAKLLDLLNERIAALRDEDHRLGHSHFLEVGGWEELRDAFADRLLPLLREYFFADYRLLRAVVGSGFCADDSPGPVSFAPGYHDELLDDDLRTYRFPVATSPEALAGQLDKLGDPWVA